MGLRCSARAFSSCGKPGLLFIVVHRLLIELASHCSGFSCCGAQVLGAQAQQLWCPGFVTPRHVGSFRTRSWTLVPCIGRRILNHWATREVPLMKLQSFYSHENRRQSGLEIFLPQFNYSPPVPQGIPCLLILVIISFSQIKMCDIYL